MRSSSLFTAALAAFSIIGLATADVEITSPTSGTEWQGGTTVTMTWKDNGNSPSLSAFSTYNVYLCWGSNDTPVRNPPIHPSLP
jgi:hypothetical protein